EAAEEGDDLVAAGRVACQFDGAFHGFRAGVAETDAARHVARRDARQRLREGDHLLIVEIGPGHVDQARSLFLDGADYLGMAVSGGGDGDARVEIEEAIAIYVLDD